MSRDGPMSPISDIGYPIEKHHAEGCLRAPPAIFFFSCSSEPSSSGHHTSMSGLRPIASSARFHFGFFEKSMTVLPALHRCCVAKNKTFSELVALLPRPNFNLWWLNGQLLIMPVCLLIDSVLQRLLVLRNRDTVSPTPTTLLDTTEPRYGISNANDTSSRPRPTTF